MELGAPHDSQPARLKRKMADDAVREVASTTELVRHGSATLPEAQPDVARPESLANGHSVEEGTAVLQPEASNEVGGASGSQQDGEPVLNGTEHATDAQALPASEEAFSDLLLKVRFPLGLYSLVDLSFLGCDTSMCAAL